MEHTKTNVAALSVAGTINGAIKEVSCKKGRDIIIMCNIRV